MNTKLSQFTKQYQLSKTVRFELKPIGKTTEWIAKHDIIGVKKDELIGKDAKKAKHYKYAKRLLDSMHRLFIEDALHKIDNTELQEKLIVKLQNISTMDDYELKKDKELKSIFGEILDDTAKAWIEQYAQDMPKFWQKTIQEMEEKIVNEQNAQQKKKYKNVIKALTKKINSPLKVFKKSGIKALYSNTEAMHLLDWKVLTGEVTATFKELEQNSKNDGNIPQKIISEYLQTFNQFYTYFSGFNENRQNVYDISGEKSTAIFNRTFKDNFSFHLENMKKWKTTQKSLEKYQKEFVKNGFDWQCELHKIEKEQNCSFAEIMTPTGFISFMNQTGIDNYTRFLGGVPALDGSPKKQGLNEIINLARQQAGAKRSQFPPMHELYKQILSKSDKTFIPEFSDDQDMLQAIKKFHKSFFVQNNNDDKNIFDKFSKDSEEFYAELNDDLEHLYLAKDKVSFLSNIITGSWQNINHGLLELLDEKEFAKRTFFSFAEIEQILSIGKEKETFTINDCYKGNLLSFFNNQFQEKLAIANDTWQRLFASSILELKKIDPNRSNEEDKGFKQIAIIKEFLDAAISLAGFVRDWQENTELLKKDDRNKLWYQHINQFITTFNVISIYNMVRNHITKKASASEKLKINFENATLLGGWDRNKESDNYGVLLKKDDCFYLAVMTKNSNNIFDYEISAKDSAKKQKVKKELKQHIISTCEANSYKKVNYKLLPGANKMLPKVFFAKGNKNLFSPSPEIINIKEQKLYSKKKIEEFGIKNLYKYIDFCKTSLMKYPDWSQAFGFTTDSFKPTQEYTSIDQFYRDVEDQGYTINFDNIKESYIQDKVDKGELYLFQIYNKDFSKNKKSKGTDNLHTIYWKGLFEPKNLQNTILKLNGQAEIFFRKASIKYTSEKLKAGHHATELKGKFNYPIIKDKRFTQNKFFFHCPITINFGSPSVPAKFNDKICTFLKDNPTVNIIGIDRGEKHLLYYSVVNQNGHIIEQGSLNKIDNGYIPNGANSTRAIDYHSKLDAIESKRDKARKSWSTIENIKELKAGYLSQVVHKLSQLIIKHNAIVVLEDLNIGFKRGRFGVEKQVYQKFEKALIDKLNYLVFKNTDAQNPGGYLNGYQLTNKFESFQKMGKQSGILFYTTASYTSTTDPVTGFLKNVYAKYQSIENSISFWKSFDSIIYNPTQDRFEFTYTLGNIITKNMYKESDDKENELHKRTWTVCSCVERSRYVPTQKIQNEEQKQNTTSEQIGNKGRHEIFFVTDKVKTILTEANIPYTENYDIKSQLIIKKDKKTHSAMIYIFNAIMNMRVTDSSKEKGSKENDFILSPVEPFFDSRKADANQPENGDANGAYNIARKGICILNNINNTEEVNKAKIAISKQQWQNFAQSKI